MRVAKSQLQGEDYTKVVGWKPETKTTLEMLEELDLPPVELTTEQEEDLRFDPAEGVACKPPPFREILAPQPGPQTMFATCTADICFYGGEAGGGKSFAEILEPVRYRDVPGFTCAILRRTFPQIKRQGGLWDTCMELLPRLGFTARESDLSFKYPNGAHVQLAQMQHEANKYDWQGSQICCIEFDEVTHFTETQFWYLVSRNRSTCGVSPYVRATCNPEPDGWVFKLIEWWIGADGFAIKERSGVLRWFVRDGDVMIWADKPEDLPKELNGKPTMPRSFTFIHATLADNAKLTAKDPGYAANLASLPLYERMLLAEGNWKVQKNKGMRFRREWIEIVDPLDVPPLVRRVRYWDRASTEKTAQSPDPDRTAGVEMGIARNGVKYVTHVCLLMGTPAKVRDAISNCASQDRANGTELWLERDPGSAGKTEQWDLSVDLAEYGPQFLAPTGSKWVRSGPASAGAENGLLKVVRGPWNEAYIKELEQFVDEQSVPKEEMPKGYHDDQVDGTSGAYNVLSTRGRPSIS